jgi:hypothetical protein
MGAPNRATIASPMILSTWPPKAMTSATSRSKQRSMRFLTFSGSVVSEKPVKPTRSANRTVAIRRSSGRLTSAWPHEGQNRAPPGAAAPHDGQVMAKG